MQVGRKDVGILINGSVLNNIDSTFANFQYLAIPTVEEVYLEIKTPTFHLGVKVIQIRIVHHILKVRFPFIVLGKQMG
jgi:hypothetical protein